jgi:phenylacetate-coenzyme A ligase PaaK-like adenylate-forming protein
MNVVFDRYMSVLEQTQWARPQHLVQYQDQLLGNLVRHAHDNVPFYRERLACLFDRSGHFDRSRWSEVSILSRIEAASHAASMRPAQLAPMHGEVTEIQTSGSIGAPLSIASNRLVHAAANAAMTRMAHWWGADTARSLARLRVYKSDAPQYPEGRDGKGWSYANPEAATHDLDLRTPAEQQLEWLARIKAPYLVTAPSNAMALAYAATAQQARDLAIELVFTTGETVLPRAREVVEDKFGARMAAIYSCEEVGTIATQCPATAGYHVVAENFLVELLRNDGTAAGPGEVGQVVVTGFYNYAMPFIRYAIGDVAIAAEGACPCGRSLPVIPQVLGRTRCAFVFADGTRIWPRGSDALAIRRFVPHREFQMVQVDQRRIEFRYVPDATGQSPDMAGLDAYMRQKFHPSAEAVLVPLQAIPRGPGGKLESFVSLVAN